MSFRSVAMLICATALETIDWLYQRLFARNSRPPFFPLSAAEQRPPITDNVRQDAAAIAQAEDGDREA
jgi:hypothetical protein